MVVLGTLLAMMVGTASTAESVRATLSDLEGDAKVMRGGRHHAYGEEGMRVRKGDHVKVPKGGHKVTVKLDDGCDYKLKDGEALTIGVGGCCALDSVGATLERAVGNILVDQGAGYIAGKVGKRLERGARVMAREKSKVTIRFDDECNHTLKDGEVLTITDVSPCNTRATLKRIEGKARVNHKARIRQGRLGQRLKKGSRVAVGKGHKAIVRFDDGCEYTLERRRDPEHRGCQHLLRIGRYL